MGWSGSLTDSSAVGSSITFTPNTTTEGAYNVSSFTAPRKGVYQFILKGSGGTKGTSKNGGTGGTTTGYLLLEKGQTVYVGAGGTCSAAFVSGANASKLSLVSKSSLYLVAGAGGAGGIYDTNADYTQTGTEGGNGGGTYGASSASGGKGGTQSAGGEPGGTYDSGNGNAGSYGTGGAGVEVYESGISAKGGRGGDGYYGGGSGHSVASHNSGTNTTSSFAYSGGGGSGYVQNASLTVLDKTYTSTTTQGGGASAGSRGSVVVTYYARAELPIVFNGTRLERLFFNGTEVESLIYNGTKLFIERIRQLLFLPRLAVVKNK